jgi:hypothetical protein
MLNFYYLVFSFVEIHLGSLLFLNFYHKYLYSLEESNQILKGELYGFPCERGA